MVLLLLLALTCVSACMQTGYRMHDRVLRAAEVGVVAER